MIKELDNLVRDFNTEDYKFICNTSINSIQFAIELESKYNHGVRLFPNLGVQAFLSLFRSECERILRIIKVVGNSVKNSKGISRKINLHYDLGQYFAAWGIVG